MVFEFLISIGIEFHCFVPNTETAFCPKAGLLKSICTSEQFLVILCDTYLDTWSGFKAAIRLLHGRVGDSTTLVNSLSPQMSELVEDAIPSWCGDIVGHFWLIRNELQKLDELKFEFFNVNTFDVSQIFWQRVVQPTLKYSYCILLKGLCWVSVCWILNNALCSMSWIFSGFYCVPHCAINICYHLDRELQAGWGADVSPRAPHSLPIL